METKCPTCGLERMVDAAAPEHGDEQMCEPCAASYRALLDEIGLRAAGRKAEDATGRVGAAPATLALPAADGDEELLPHDLEASAERGREAAEADGYAVGVSLYRVPASGLVVVGICLCSILFLVGWLSPAGVFEPDAVAESARISPPAQVQGAADKFAPAPPQADADAGLLPAASHTPLLTTEEPAAETTTAATAAATDDELNEGDDVALGEDETEGDGPASEPVTRTQPVAGGTITIQVGSYNKPEEAEGRASMLRAAGFDARVAAVEIPKKGTWFRVQSGRFQTREQAGLYEKSLRASGAADATFVAEIQN
jgi:cell division septation protein DedD